MEQQNKERNLLKAAFEIEEARELPVKEEMFVSPVYQLIWKIYKFLNFSIDEEKVLDSLHESENDIHVPAFKEILEKGDTSEWRRDFEWLKEAWRKRSLIYIANSMLTDNRSTKEIIEFIKDSIRKLEDPPVHKVKNDVNNVMLRILRKSEGDEPTVINSGYTAFDNISKLDFGRIFLLAGPKKIGKTKFIINYTVSVLMNMKDVGVHFYSFELNYDEMIYEMIAMLTGLTIDQILSKDYSLTEGDQLLIQKATKKISKLDMNIVTDTVSIDELYDQHISFASKRKHSIVVIDNIGLLMETKRGSESNDVYIAKKMVELKKKTNSLIIPIHHMTKDMDKENRIKDGYRPRLEFLRGSTRLQDYCNMVALIHRPGHYPDLVNRERLRKTVKIGEKIYNREPLIKKLFLIDIAANRNGSKAVIRFLHRLDRTQFKLFNYSIYG